MEERISTGITSLDREVKGFKKNSVNLVAGSAGSGKTIMAIQFLMEGIKKGDNGVYITFEERKSKTYDYMRSFGWDLEKHEKEKKFVFLEYTPEQVKRLITEGGGEIENIIKKSGARRIVIDSITSFALLYQDELTRKEAALSLFELINSWNCTALLTSQTAEKNSLSSELQFEVDSIMILYHVPIKGTRKRGFEVIKMRGTKIPDKTFPLSITSNGIEINTKKVAII